MPNTRGVLINGGGGWEPLKETNKLILISLDIIKKLISLGKWGGVRNSQKNGFLRYLLETGAFHMLRTLEVVKKQM